MLILKLISVTLPPSVLQVPMEEEVNQTAIPSADKYLGEGKGIQGHYSSCYLDSTLFGLFALSNAFDSDLLDVSEEDASTDRRTVGELLAKKVVNPLRK